MTHRTQTQNATKMPAPVVEKTVGKTPKKTVTKAPEETSAPSETPASSKVKDEGPKPTHFLARDDGKYTPLIALDELPEGIKLEGLPLYITAEELLKWKATACFPAVAQHPRPYNVMVDGPELEEGEASDAESGNVPSTRAINARLAHGGPKNKKQPEDIRIHTGAVAKKNQAGGPVQRYNPTTPGVLGRKLFCTHWMRTGECDFTQQGCMFHHRMPDLDTLELLGFRSYPRWFREMPRDYQLENANDFDESGLDPRRHKAIDPSPPRGLRTNGHGYHGGERGGTGREYGRENAAPYGRNNGYNYGREREYGRYDSPPAAGAGPYPTNHPAGHGYSPRGGPRGFTDHYGQDNYGQGHWNAPPHNIPSHQRIWSLESDENHLHSGPPSGMPFGRPFVPRTAPAGNNGNAINHSSGTSSAMTPPAHSPMIGLAKGDIRNEHSFFSRDASPMSTVNRMHPAPNLGPPDVRRAPGPSGAPFRSLYDGIPSSPEPTYTKRFNSGNGAKPKTFAAPDANVTAAAAATAVSPNKQHERKHSSGFGNGAGRGRGRRALTIRPPPSKKDTAAKTGNGGPVNASADALVELKSNPDMK